MFSFERFMKKLKGYVRNKAKPKCSIAEGYVAEEAFTFSSHYFWDVTTKFNRPDRNVDPPPPTCQFQVFRSLCKSISLRSVIRFDTQELKKVIWYVLYNSPEIDTYRSQFKSKFPNKDMKEEFPDWFGLQIRQHYVDNDPGVSATSELFALACGPTPTPISVNSCVVNGVRFVVHRGDERRTTQNNGICSPGGKDGEMYYGTGPRRMTVDGDDRPPLHNHKPTRYAEYAVSLTEMESSPLGSSNTPSGVPYTDEEINALAPRGQAKRSGGTFPLLDVRVLSRRYTNATDVPHSAPIRSRHKHCNTSGEYASTSEEYHRSSTAGVAGARKDEMAERYEDGGEDEETRRIR
ncbi:proton-dependent oligopeptide transporter family protein [Tanacetum coccineum]